MPALRAYLISHLGKYVPGKAMVVVMRAGLAVPFGARAATAAFATFYETLVMMAAGGLVAAVGFAMAGDSARVAVDLPGLGHGRAAAVPPGGLLGPGAGAGVPGGGRAAGLPPAGAAGQPAVPGVGPEALPRLSGRLLVEGLLWSSAGWVLLGLSQVAVVRALAAGADRARTSGSCRWSIASVALATVAGFVVAVLPGGLGVREGVLMTALAPALGRGPGGRRGAGAAAGLGGRRAARRGGPAPAAVRRIASA